MPLVHKIPVHLDIREPFRDGRAIVEPMKRAFRDAVFCGDDQAIEITADLVRFA